ncbi:P-loop NTPase fold protein [Cobetia marina]|uniref:P-loop NTPase fold protein n=1 Tax=Cobetia marina TaxID=28258 RepID=UPI0017489BA1
MTTETNVKIISDVPSYIDEFTGKAHERTAIALADTIEQLLEGRGGAIGLEGPWGAGKSTIISIAAENLKESEDKKMLVFTFDLWAHQASNFKRAFLESFVEWLENEKGVAFTSKNSEEIKDRIRDKKKTIKIEKENRFSIAGSVFLILMPLMPIIYTWLSPLAFKEGIHSEYAKYAFYFLVAAYSSIMIRGLYHCINEKNIVKGVSKAISFLSKEVDSETISQNIRDSEPTNVEFFEIFDDILAKVKVEKRGIIFVLDNIDRVVYDQIPELWSEIRAVFIHSGPSIENNVNIVAVLPYDKHHLKEAFNCYNEGDEPNHKSYKFEGVLEKTFSRILQVSPPIMTDWKHYLYSKLDLAFPKNISAADKETIFRLLKLKFQDEDIHPTPRRLISFVNNIGSIYSQRGKEVDVVSIALYVMHKRNIEDKSLGLRDSSVISHRYINISAVVEWRKNLAALLYNVDVEVANQVLLHDPIKESLEKDDDSMLRNLEEINGFYELLPDIIHEYSEEWGNSDPILFAKVIRNLARLEEAKVTPDQWADLALSVGKLSFSYKVEARKVPELFEITHNLTADQATKYVKRVLDSLREYVESAAEVNALGGWWLRYLKEMARVLAEQPDSKLGILLWLKRISIPGDIDFILNVSIEASKDGPFVMQDMYIDADLAELPIKIVQVIEDKSVDAVSLIGAWEYRLSDLDFKLMAETLMNSYMVKHEEYDANRYSLAEILLFIYKALMEKSIFNDVVSDWKLLKIISHSIKSDDVESFSKLLYLSNLVYEPDVLANAPNVNQLNQNPALRESFKVVQDFLRQSNFDDEYVASVSECFVAHNDFDLLVDRALNNKKSGYIYCAAVKSSFELDSIGKIDINYYIENYSKIKKIVDGVNLDTVFAQMFLDIDIELWVKIEMESITQEFIDDVIVYGSEDISSGLINALKNHCEKINKEKLVESLATEDHDLMLLIGLKKMIPSFTLPSPVIRESILEHVKKILRCETSPSSYTSKWGQVCGLLKSQSRSATIESILHALFDGDYTDESVVIVIELYADLISEAKFDVKPDNALDKVFRKLVSSDSPIVLGFINNAKDQIQKCFKTSGKHSQELFNEYLLMQESKASKEIKCIVEQ